MSTERLGNESKSSTTVRATLPVLVRQAQAGRPITYDALGKELGVHPRAFRHALGVIAEALHDLGAQWDQEIAPLTSLVINSHTGRPGPGFGWAVSGILAHYGAMTAGEQAAAAEVAQVQCYRYDRWPEVLQALGLAPLPPAVPEAWLVVARRGSAEGPAHQRLKAYVAAHPVVVGLPRATPPGEMEYTLPSADRIDVLFDAGPERVAVEVKAADAGPGDVLRGLYQCVKYAALLAAEQALAVEPAATRAVLVLGGRLPEALVAVRNALGVAVMEGVAPD